METEGTERRVSLFFPRRLEEQRRDEAGSGGGAECSTAFSVKDSCVLKQI